MFVITIKQYILNKSAYLGDQDEHYQKTKRRIVFAYITLAFPSVMYSVFLGFFFVADELTTLGSVGLGIVGFLAPCCLLFSPPVMGKWLLNAEFILTQINI